MLGNDAWGSLVQTVREQIGPSDFSPAHMVGVEVAIGGVKLLCYGCTEELDEVDFIPGNVRAKFALLRCKDSTVVIFVHSEKPKCVEALNSVVREASGESK